MTDYTEYTVREYSNGDRKWYQNGDLHRTDGPAIEYASSNRLWYQNGKRHRVDGPAIESASGYREWWLDGEHVTEAEHARLTSPAEEMTLAEVCEALGKNIKIVKG